MLSFNIVLFLNFICLIFGANLPNYIPRCKIEQLRKHECAKEAAQKALSFISKGDKEFHLPSFTPYNLSQIELNSGDNLKMKFENCVLWGLENNKFTNVDFDVDKRHVHFEGTLDRTNMLAHYEMNGRILVLPISGNGPANITFVGIKFVYDLDYDLYEKNGQEHMKMGKSNLTFVADRAYYKLENLFNGDKLLGDQLNKFLDENWEEVGKDINPALTEIVKVLIARILKNLFSRVPYKDFFEP